MKFLRGCWQEQTVKQSRYIKDIFLLVFFVPYLVEQIWHLAIASQQYFYICCSLFFLYYSYIDAQESQYCNLQLKREQGLLQIFLSLFLGFCGQIHSVKIVSVIELCETFIVYKDLFIELREIAGYYLLCPFKKLWVYPVFLLHDSTE